jgi:hypothetical protein
VFICTISAFRVPGFTAKIDLNDRFRENRT